MAETQQNKRAGIYARISRDSKGEGLGVERQTQLCEALADRLGYDIAKVYTDNDISAYSGRRRPAYDDLLADVQGGRIDAVLCYHIDRLMRLTKELESYIEVCGPRGVPTHQVQAGEIDLTTPSGRAVAKTLGAWSQYESEHKGERIRSQKAQAAKAGKYLGGRIPWGWQRMNGTIEPEPTAARFIQEGTQAILAGHSLIEVTRRWADAGALSLSGTRMNTTQVRRTLLRPRNAGLVTFHGETVAESWPAVVSLEDFRALESKLNDRSIPRQSAAKFKYLLSGLVLCHCGLYMTGYGAQATAEKPGYRRMYRCRIHAEGGRYVRGHATREMHTLDNYVLAVVAGYVNRADVRAAVLAAATEQAEGTGAVKPADTAELLTRKADLARLFAGGVIEESQLIEGTSQIRNELAEIERRAVQQGGNGELVAVLATADPGAAFMEAQTGVQRAVIKALAAVRILEGAKPGAGFNPDLVDFGWKALRHAT